MTNSKIPPIILKQEKRLVKLIATSLSKLGSTLHNQILNGDIDSEIVIQLTFDKLVPQITNELQKTYTRAGKLIRKDMQLVTGSEYIIEQAVRYIHNKSMIMLGSSDISITQTTKDNIKVIISDGLNKGNSYNEIAKEILSKTEAGILSANRAQMIAVRELGDAYENGRLTTLNKHLQQTGDRAEKIWDTVGDSRVTPQCRANENQGRILQNEKFPSGDDIAPRDTNPRCRCTTNYRLI